MKEKFCLFFNREGALQVKTLLENISRREIAAVDSYQHIEESRVDISSFFVEDLSQFCACATYVLSRPSFHSQVNSLIDFCKQSPFRSDLSSFLSVAPFSSSHF